MSESPSRESSDDHVRGANDDQASGSTDSGTSIDEPSRGPEDLPLQARASDTELLSTLFELGREVTSVLDLDELLRADAEQRRLQIEHEDLQRQRNENARNVKAAAAADRPALIQHGRDIGARIQLIQPEIDAAKRRLRDLMLVVPQIPAADAPRGSYTPTHMAAKQRPKPATNRRKPARLSLAQRADKYDCYQRSVQCVEAEIDFPDEDDVPALLAMVKNRVKSLVTDIETAVARAGEP